MEGGARQLIVAYFGIYSDLLCIWIIFLFFYFLVPPIH